MRQFRVICVATALMLAACSHTPPAPTAPLPAPSAPAPSAPAKAPASATKPAPAAPAPASPAPASPLFPQPPNRPLQPARQLADGSQVPAVQGLLAAADRALQANNPDLAAVSLERAQRLAPQSAAVYQRLADVRLRQQRPAESEQMARKALAYATQLDQQAALWRQIAAARQAMGQAQAAQDALQRAAALEGTSEGAP